MYRQVNIEESDSYYQCILWRKNSNERFKTFRLKTLTYGTASASFLATRALSYLADESLTKFLIGSKIIKRDFYVDDFITGGSSFDEINNVRFEVNSILTAVPECEREKLIAVDDSSFLKALGICWQPSSDEIRYVIACERETNEKITKRTVLGYIARLFDPMGLINPVVVWAKIFMQNLWLLKLDWDESLPTELHASWRNFKSQLPTVNNIRLPRFVFATTVSSFQIHDFADASLRAYGGCIYIRCIDNFGNIHVKLLLAKSRVAPSKAQTIPRLELFAALLLGNLLKTVRKNILNYEKILLWTDSEIVLAWLASHSLTLTTFVSNRVSQIQELTEGIKWRHIASSSNAADILSRGCTPEELINSNWFNGPEFLSKPEE